MPGQIEVVPEQLTTAAGESARISERVDAERARLNVVASGVAGATGDGAAQGAFLGLAGAADRALAALSGDATGLGALLHGASGVYTQTDHGAIPTRR